MESIVRDWDCEIVVGGVVAVVVEDALRPAVAVGQQQHGVEGFVGIVIFGRDRQRDLVHW